MKKQVFAVLLAAAMCLTMVGCGSKAEEAPAAQEAVVEETDEISVEESTEEVPVAEETSENTAETADLEGEQTIEGILADGTMNGLTIAVNGQLITLSTNDDTQKNLSDGMQIGKSILVTYEGDLNGDVTVTALSDGTKTPVASTDELSFATEVMFAFDLQDMELLSQLISDDCYVNLGDSDMQVKTPEEFMKLDSSKIFTTERTTAVMNTDLYTLEGSNAGLVLGDGTPNVTFQDDGTGTYEIVGIN